MYYYSKWIIRQGVTWDSDVFRCFSLSRCWNMASPSLVLSMFQPIDSMLFSDSFTGQRYVSLSYILNTHNSLTVTFWTVSPPEFDFFRFRFSRRNKTMVMYCIYHQFPFLWLSSFEVGNIDLCSEKQHHHYFCPHSSFATVTKTLFPLSYCHVIRKLLYFRNYKEQNQIWYLLYELRTSWISKICCVINISDGKHLTFNNNIFFLIFKKSWLTWNITLLSTVKVVLLP